MKKILGVVNSLEKVQQESTYNARVDTAITSLKILVTDNIFTCSICQETCADPHAVPECLHRFCGGCLKKCPKMFGKACTCCRDRFASKRDLSLDATFDNIVSAWTHYTWLINARMHDFVSNSKALTVYYPMNPYR